MANKFGKFVLFSAVAGAAAAGAYYYLQNKEKSSAKVTSGDDDDFDDFTEDLEEDLDAPTPTRGRTYVNLNLDKAEAVASEAFQKAKEVISDSVQQVKETVKSVTESSASSKEHFVDLSEIKSKPVAADPASSLVKEASVQASQSAEDIAAVKEPTVDEAAQMADTVSTEAVTDGDAVAKVDEFFDDDDEN